MVRLENLDPERCRPAFAEAMLHDLAWFGLDWDVVVDQHAQRAHHEAALDQLAARNLVYPCDCGRSRIKNAGRTAADGGYMYDNTCRHKHFPAGGWRNHDASIRLKLSGEEIEIRDEDGEIYRQVPAQAMGDPVVRRRDGAIAYHLACVVDDERAGVKRLIRGRDLLPSAPTQIMIQRQLGYNTPAYRHHFLFLENHGGKLAKFHGAVGVTELKKTYSGPDLCGMIAHWAGITTSPAPCRPSDLIATFDWRRIRRSDLALTWDGEKLHSPLG